MKLLLDQDVYAGTARLLEEAGHEVTRVAELELAMADDSTLLKVARERESVLVTRDRDYGYLVFVERLRTGVIYLRMQPTTMGVVHRELVRVLESYPFDRLMASFAVVEPGQHRIRSFSP